MSRSGFATSENDFSQSQTSLMSKFDFQIKSHELENSESVIDQSMVSVCNFQKQCAQTPHGSKKLYLNNLQNQQQNNSEKRKQAQKQNNIPSKAQELYIQSRKIVLHKNNSISPFRNSQAIDESFSTNKIVQLQQQLIQLRKELSLKESSWIKQKSILLNKIQIANFDVAEMKQRNRNLIQINQTLTQALGESNKNSLSSQSQIKFQEMTKQLFQKNKKINCLEQNINKMEKQKIFLNQKYKDQQEKNQRFSKKLEEFKTIIKQSNQRKFESDEKIVLLAKNYQILKKKLTELPIKNEYLKPIYSFLEQSYTHFSSEQLLQISNLSKLQPQYKYFKANKLNKNQPEEYYQRDKSRFIQEDQQSNEQNYLQQSTQNLYINENFTTSYLTKKYKEQPKFFDLGNQVKRINTDENQEEDHFVDQYHSQDEVYLCGVCQRVYPHQEFFGHMKDCQEYQILLKEKKNIESKMIAIKEQQYQNRKSCKGSLNNSTIILNKSKSKNKFNKPTENLKTNRAHQRPSNQNGNNKNKNGNKTERYLHRQDSNDSNLELSQLMNISQISNQPRNANLNKVKNGFINSNNYFTAEMENHNYSNFKYQEQKCYKFKPNPEIKYQTNIPNQNSIGKQSMQEEIRKIVEALNEGKKQKNKNDSNLRRPFNLTTQNCRNQLGKFSRNKPNFY